MQSLPQFLLQRRFDLLVFRAGGYRCGHVRYDCLVAWQLSCHTLFCLSRNIFSLGFGRKKIGKTPIFLYILRSERKYTEILRYFNTLTYRGKEQGERLGNTKQGKGRAPIFPAGIFQGASSVSPIGIIL